MYVSNRIYNMCLKQTTSNNSVLLSLHSKLKMFRPASIGPGYFPKVTWVVQLPGKSRMDISWAKKRHTGFSQALPRSLDFLCRQREACGDVKMEMIHTSVLFRNTRLYSGKCNEFQWASPNLRTQPHPQWASTSPRMPCPLALGSPGPTARDPRTQFCPPAGRHQPQDHLSPAACCVSTQSTHQQVNMSSSTSLNPSASQLINGPA